MIAPAKTGKDRSNNTAVIKTDQINKEIWLVFKNLIFIFNIVEIKLIAPKIEEIPAICNEKIEISTDDPECAIEEERGG